MSLAHCLEDVNLCTNDDDCTCSCAGCILSIKRDELALLAGYLRGLALSERPLDADDRAALTRAGILFANVVHAVHRGTFA